MKFAIFSILILGATTMHSQANYKSNFLKKWQNAANYTIECAEAMPEDKYDYKPTDDARTFEQQLLHMVSNMMWLSSDYLGGEKYEKDLKNTVYSKQEVLTILNETFAMSRATVEALPEEKMGEVVKFFAGPMELQQIMMLMTDHMTHHRGQILVYLRLNDIKAPKYRGW